LLAVQELVARWKLRKKPMLSAVTSLNEVNQVGCRRPSSVIMVQCRGNLTEQLEHVQELMPCVGQSQVLERATQLVLHFQGFCIKDMLAAEDE
jgi:hypothetical protein